MLEVFSRRGIASEYGLYTGRSASFIAPAAFFLLIPIDGFLRNRVLGGGVLREILPLAVLFVVGFLGRKGV